MQKYTGTALLNKGRAGKKTAQKVSALLATTGSDWIYYSYAKLRLKILILFYVREKK